MINPAASAVTSKPANGGHLKTGQWWSPENRPTELTQDKVVIACRRVFRQ
jgi:hypothetical protein